MIASLDIRANDGDVAFYGELQGAEHSIQTDDGNILLEIPASSTLLIEMYSDSGDIHSQFPLQIEGSNRHYTGVLNSPESTLSIHTDHGEVTLREWHGE